MTRFDFNYIIHRYPLLSPEDQVALGWQMIEPDPIGLKARQKMVLHNLRLVIDIAHGLEPRIQRMAGSLTFEDLLEEGAKGLIRACEKFEPQRGWKFSTYAYWWIRQGMTRAIPCQHSLLQKPVYLHELFFTLRKGIEIFTRENNRPPNEEQLEQIWSEVNRDKRGGRRTDATAREVLLAFQTPTSTDRRISEDSDQYFDIPDRAKLPEEIVYQSNLVDYTHGLIDSLNDQQRAVITLRYGLNGEPQHTADATAEKLGIPRYRIKTIERNAMLLMRRRAASRGRFELFEAG